MNIQLNVPCTVESDAISFFVMCLAFAGEFEVYCGLAGHAGDICCANQTAGKV